MNTGTLPVALWHPLRILFELEQLGDVNLD